YSASSCCSGVRSGYRSAMVMSVSSVCSFIVSLLATGAAELAGAHQSDRDRVKDVRIVKPVPLGREVEVAPEVRVNFRDPPRRLLLRRLLSAADEPAHRSGWIFVHQQPHPLGRRLDLLGDDEQEGG